jgi:hypothetical protein
MTKEEIENTYEFKIIKKAVMREFPFIKDVFISEDDSKELDGYKYIYFISAKIDPFIMTNLYGGQVWVHVIDMMRKYGEYNSSFLTTFVRSEDRDPISSIGRELKSLVRGIHDTETLPREFKLDKYIEFDTFISDKSSIPPLYNPDNL